MHDQNVVRRRNFDDRSKIFGQLEWHVRKKSRRCSYRHAHGKDGHTIGWPFEDLTARNGHYGSWVVFDDDFPALALCYFVGDHAADDVGRSTWRSRDKDANRSRWKGLRLSIRWRRVDRTQK